MKDGEFKLFSVPGTGKPGLKITRTMFGFLLENYYLTNKQPVYFDAVTIEPNDLPELIKFFQEQQSELAKPEDKT